MNTGRFLEDQKEAKRVPLTKADNYTITIADLDSWPVFRMTVASKTFTLPAASKAIAGIKRVIKNAAAGTIAVTVAAGFGGVGAGYTIATIYRGSEMAIACDGTYWGAQVGTLDSFS